MATTSTGEKKGGLHVVAWIVQVLLALAFLGSGSLKALTPWAVLTEKMSWVLAIGPLVRVIGACEIAGALGLILPSATRIKPGLTPLAAAGLLTIMVLAAGFHVSRSEFGALPPNIVLGALAAFVGWARWKKSPIAPR